MPIPVSNLANTHLTSCKLIVIAILPEGTRKADNGIRALTKPTPLRYSHATVDMVGESAMSIRPQPRGESAAMDRQIESRSPSRPDRVRDPGDAVRDAFRQRAGHAIDHLARSATVAALTEALAASTDFGAVARALRDPNAFPAALSLDPMTDALARGAVEREHLAIKAKGLLSAEDAGRALGGISRQAVDKRRRGRQLLGIKVASDWRYPAAQIGSDGEVIPGLAKMLEDLADLSPWAILDFLLAEDAALGGASPLGALREGGTVADAAGRIARAYKSDAFG
jgi:CRP-like cAMP-binding protein